MGNYLIVDSNVRFAEKLYQALTDKSQDASPHIVDTASFNDLAMDLSRVSDEVARRAKSSKLTVLINAEALTRDGLRQHQKVVDLVFWLRCKHNLRNAIATYSVQSLDALLKKKPEHFILHSPGTYHFQLPLGYSDLKRIANLQPLDDISTIKPYLRPRINLDRIRHTYANYAGIASMFELSKRVWEIKQISKRFLDAADLTRVSEFRSSLDSYLLKTYFTPEAEATADLQALKISNPPRKVLLLDDLADMGWRLVLSQMIYGKPDDDRIWALPVPTTEAHISQAIREHKPDLLLLDLRLDNEIGNTPTRELGGYKLLSFLKSSLEFKGLPVVMFTASSNAQTTKDLIYEGAEAVWTKPGLDEQPSSGVVVSRYAELLALVNQTTNKHSQLALPVSKYGFGDFRIRFFEKIEWIKYRLGLYSSAELEKFHKATAFYGFTDIYIDTNYLINNDDKIDILESLSNLYIVSSITSNTKKTYKVDGKRFGYVEPKIVISNQVLDELIKRIKRGNEQMDSTVYAIVRELSGRRIRSEYSRFTDNPAFRPMYKMNNPKENLYADPFLLDDISQLIVLGYQKITFQDEFNAVPGQKKKVYFPDRNVLLVTNDHDLTEKTRKMLPSGTFRTYRIEEFNKEARGVDL